MSTNLNSTEKIVQAAATVVETVAPQTTTAINEAVKAAEPIITAVETGVSQTVPTVVSGKQNRFKSYLLWSAIVAQLLAVGQLTGLFKKLGIDTGTVGNVIAGVLQLLVVVGILNNPTDSTSL